MSLRQAAQQALEALIPLANAGCPNERECLTDKDHERAADAVEALEQALAEREQEMPSDTRYTVAVEGQAPTYWDCIHDAMTNAQRAVYSGVDNTTRAIDDLKAGRIAEWSYGFSAVRIYPPQSKTAPTPRKPLTDEEIEAMWQNTSPYYDHQDFARAIERAHGIYGKE